MANKNTDDDFSLFSAEFSGIKKMQQDTIKLPAKNMKKKQVIKEKFENTLEINHFSDEGNLIRFAHNWNSGTME